MSAFIFYHETFHDLVKDAEHFEQADMEDIEDGVIDDVTVLDEVILTWIVSDLCENSRKLPFSVRVRYTIQNDREYDIFCE